MATVAERRRKDPAITVNEAAFVSGLSVKTINQAIDREHIHTLDLQRTSDRAKRGVAASDAVFLFVSQLLSPELRPKVYRSFHGKDLSQLPHQLEMGSVILNLQRAIEEVEERMKLLQRMQERIEINPAVCGGEPVFRGTRIMVHGLARKLGEGSTIQELVEDHPRISEDDIHLAVQYAKLYPRRGRPHGPWPKGMKRISRTGPV
jgi:uncharacterized protein (DUF433 family)